jgi:hypothetical protein
MIITAINEQIASGIIKKPPFPRIESKLILKPLYFIFLECTEPKSPAFAKFIYALPQMCEMYEN